MAKKKLIGISFKRLRLSDLKETTGNPQKMTLEEMNGLINSMKKNGWILDAPVVWERRKEDYQIISGHHRVQAAIEAGIIETDVKVIKGINEEQARKLVIEANQRRGQLDNIELNEFINTIIDDFDADIDQIMEDVGIFDEDIFNDKSEDEEIEIKEKEADYYISFLVNDKQRNFIEKRLMQIEAETQTEKLIILCQI